ncbi:MAG: polysaccharide biosynthesis tyrosine autokinase, partial [Planctomycetes bacterium]|nr:polysaccharide biosynthesis tyrosine autokinase [Planctomycetota bacterium]
MSKTTNPRNTSSRRAQAPGPRIDVWRIVLRHGWLIALASLVGAGLGYLRCSRRTPIYESRAQLLITNPKGSPLPVRGFNPTTRRYEDNVATYSRLIRSPLVVDRAVTNHKLNSLSSLAKSANPSQGIIGGITVRCAEGAMLSNVLELRFKGTDPQDCARVLEAVVSSYQKFQEDTAQSVRKQTLDLIAEAKDSLLVQLTEKETTYRRFLQEAPLLWSDDEGTNIHQARLGRIEEARCRALLALARTKAYVQAVERALMQRRNRAALTLMVERLAQRARHDGNSNQSLAGQLLPLLVEEEMLIENHGPDHPKVEALERRIEVMRRYFRSATLGPDRGVGIAVPADSLAVYLGSFREEMNAAQQRLRELDVLFDRERDNAEAMAFYEVYDETFRNDVARTRRLFELVAKRLEEITFVRKDRGSQAQLIAPPECGARIGSNYARTVAFGCFAGMFAGLALGCLVELADKSFRSPEELTEHLDLPVVGRIPFVRPNERAGSANSEHGGAARPKLDPMLLSYHEPASPASEAYRAVRTALYFGMSGKTHKTIQVSSPNKGDGKSSLAANLAVSIAQSGKRTLLIDADLRRPRVHTLFNLDRAIGLSSVIKGDANLESAIQATEVENLWCVTSGMPPSNPSELLTSRSFQDLLDEWKQQYEYLIVDTPPLLAVTDPGVVAARVDGVLLVIRNTKKAKQDATWASEALNSLGANTLGIVVTATGEGRSSGRASSAWWARGRMDLKPGHQVARLLDS